MQFEWSESKNRINRLKHGVWFEEAKKVFFDRQHKIYYDAKHSIGEDRYTALGFGDELKVLVVFHTYRDDRIRLISARKATNIERRFYFGRRIRLL